MGGIGGIGVQDWQAEAEAIRDRTAAETSQSMGLGKGSEEVKLVEDIAAKVEGKSKYIRKVFRDFDEDFDGTVNHNEFKKGLEHLGVKLDDRKFDMLLKLVDQDGSGSVDYLEFSNVLKGQDMQIGMQVGDSVDPKVAKMPELAAPAPAPALACSCCSCCSCCCCSCFCSSCFCLCCSSSVSYSYSSYS